MANVAVLTDSTASIPEHLLVAEAVGQGKAKIAYMHAGAQREVERIGDLVEARVNAVESFMWCTRDPVRQEYVITPWKHELSHRFGCGALHQDKESANLR